MTHDKDEQHAEELFELLRPGLKVQPLGLWSLVQINTASGYKTKLGLYRLIHDLFERQAERKPS